MIENLLLSDVRDDDTSFNRSSLLLTWLLWLKLTRMSFCFTSQLCIDWIKCDSPLIWLINDWMYALNVLCGRHRRAGSLSSFSGWMVVTMLMGNWVAGCLKKPLPPTPPINVINLSCFGGNVTGHLFSMHIYTRVYVAGEEQENDSSRVVVVI